MRLSSLSLGAAVILLTVAACSGGGDAGAASADAGPTETSGGTTRWFAISTLRLGSTDRTTGAREAGAWRQYGFDLDARTTTDADSQANRDTCRRHPAAGSRALTDGDDGVDNNFGKHVMVTLTSLKDGVEEAANDFLGDGHGTLLLRLDNVGPYSNASVPGALYVAGDLGQKPSFTEADVWPIDASSIGSVGEPKLRFPGGYMVRGTWVSGALGVASAGLPIPGFTNGSALPLESVVIAFDVTTGDGGTIAGAARVDALSTALRPLLASVDVCHGTPTFDTVMMSIAASADLVASAPSLQDPTRDCDAISIGLGFTARPTGAPTTTVPPGPPLVGSCP